MTRENTFHAFRVFEDEPNKFSRRIVSRSMSELPENDVLIKVHYAGLNYKDALSAFGNRGVTRKYPHTPGIDASGVVVDDRTGTFANGQEVIVSGFDLGMNVDGGFGAYIRVPVGWIVPLPEGLSMKKSMILGTSGFTAAMLINAIQHNHVVPTKGPVIVTGAAGGVGSLTVLILKKLGFEVIAATSTIDDSHEFISLLGADAHVDKSATIDSSGRPLLQGKYAAAIDCVGGDVLATLLKSVKDNGTVACCGNIFSHELNTTVYPFILRGIGLQGVSAQNTPIAERKIVWEKLSTDFDVDIPGEIIQEINPQGLEDALQIMISKKNRGQVILCHEE